MMKCSPSLISHPVTLDSVGEVFYVLADHFLLLLSYQFLHHYSF